MRIGRFEDETELGELSRIMGWAFGSAPEETSGWFEKTGRENVRLAHFEHSLAGALVHLPMGQFFGQNSVPMVGIAGVAVAPEHRGRGVAVSLMRASLRELHAGGVALSTLYPATQTLYRAAGYEQAGTRFSYMIRPRELPTFSRELVVARLEPHHDAAVEAVYTRHARSADGWLDRKRYIWERVRTPRNAKAQGFGVFVDSELEGYLYMQQRRTHGARYELSLTDVVALTPRAGQRLLGLIADHRSLGETIVWHGGPSDSLLALLPEQHYQMRLEDQWMLRIVHTKAALEARGYPAGLEAKLELAVEDPDLPANSGSWVLEVSDGRGALSAGGDGRLRTGIRGLAALYSGYLDPEALRRAGLLAGDDASLARARAVFAGPSPGMPDSF